MKRADESAAAHQTIGKRTILVRTIGLCGEDLTGTRVEDCDALSAKNKCASFALRNHA